MWKSIKAAECWLPVTFLASILAKMVTTFSQTAWKTEIPTLPFSGKNPSKQRQALETLEAKREHIYRPKLSYHCTNQMQPGCKIWAVQWLFSGIYQSGYVMKVFLFGRNWP